MIKLDLPSYNELFTFNNLYISYLKARKSKKHKKDIIKFELNASYNIWLLKNSLNKREYKIKKYNHFIIYESKLREVDSIPFSDRIVQHCLVDFYLMPLLVLNELPSLISK